MSSSHFCCKDKMSEKLAVLDLSLTPSKSSVRTSSLLAWNLFLENGGSSENKTEIRLHGRFDGSVGFSSLFVFTISLHLTGRESLEM